MSKIVTREWEIKVQFSSVQIINVLNTGVNVSTKLGISGSIVSDFPTRKVIQQSFEGNIEEHNVPLITNKVIRDNILIGVPKDSFQWSL